MLDAITATQLAMDFDQLHIQTLSHNVTNMNTPGFKRQLIDGIAFDEHLRPQTNSLLNQLHQSELTTQGTLSQTHTSTDLAISGGGYFQVQGEQGIYYTRRGDFQINSQGELATATGETLLGTNGVVKVENASFNIDTQGALSIDNRKVDQLNLVRFNQPEQLNYLGNGLYSTQESPIPIDGSTRVLQGFIEQSNVKSIDEMMDMITISRHFEANQKVMRTADNLLSTAINQLGEGNV
ncbi:MAG: flagellar hook-basal body protein [Legionellales bacterium]